MEESEKAAVLIFAVDVYIYVDDIEIFFETDLVARLALAWHPDLLRRELH